MDKFYLLPGAIFADRRPHIVDTVLGSCVAVVLWDSALHFGGINHFMLPNTKNEGNSSSKYGDVAIQSLLKRMLQLGSRKYDLKAKVFGGSVSDRANGIFQIGQRNTEFAFGALKIEGIPVVSQSVGGGPGRKIIFYSQTGDVLVKFMKSPRIHAVTSPQKLNHG
jgi:chemotaxis protein CheD